MGHAATAEHDAELGNAQTILVSLQRHQPISAAVKEFGEKITAFRLIVFSVWCKRLGA